MKIEPLFVALVCLSITHNVMAAVCLSPSFETARIFDNTPALSTLIGDFNGDGKLDLVMINDGGFSIGLGNGDGSFQSISNYTGAAVAVGDFNGDGTLDLVNAGGGIVWLG